MMLFQAVVSDVGTILALAFNLSIARYSLLNQRRTICCAVQKIEWWKLENEATMHAVCQVSCLTDHLCVLGCYPEMT